MKIDCCKPDCPDRCADPNCHGYCEKYKQQKIELEKTRAAMNEQAKIDSELRKQLFDTIGKVQGKKHYHRKNKWGNL